MIPETPATPTTPGGGLMAWFAGHPTAANLLMLLFLFIGAITLRDLRRETFPDFAADIVQIQIVYPGATAEEVEEAVCQRAEDALDGVTGLEELTSEAREGLGVITAEMAEGGDIDRFLMDVKTEVEAIDDFPDEAEDPVIQLLNRTDLVVALAVTGPMEPTDLKVYCEDVKDRLQQLPGVSQINLQGFSDREIRIEIPASTLSELGLSVADIAQRIEAQSFDLPAGTIETSDADILLRFADQRRRIHEFEDLVVVSGPNGAEILLGDIATIHDGFQDAEDKILFNGQRAGILEITKTKAQDSLRILDQVKAFLERERLIAPPTVHYALTKNISKIVRDRLDMLVKNGVQGLILVFLSMWLFFTFRYSFWVAMGLPVSFLAALFGMQALDLSLNMLSMVGLLLATGLLMDDAIVIAENVAAHLEQGKSALRATIDGTVEVAPGVFSSYLTTAAVFGSIALFIAGDIGKVLWVMPVVLLLTLTVSLVEAFLILPHHLAHSLKGRERQQPGRVRRAIEGGFAFARDRMLVPTARFAVSWRYATLGLVVSLFLLAIGLVVSGVVKFQAFPDIDGDVIQARVLLPQGTPLERTEQVVTRIADAAADLNAELAPLQPDGQDLIQATTVLFNVNADAGEVGPHVATVSLDLLNAETRATDMDEFVNRWRERVGEVPDVISINFTEPMIGPAGLAIDVRLQGRDLDRLKSASLELMNWLAGYDGVVDLRDDLRPGKPELVATLREGALAMGLNAADVARQLRAAFYGQEAQEIQVGPESFEINVRVAESDRDALADLNNFHITDGQGNQVPLTSVARLEESRGWARIARIDGLRTVTIKGDVDTTRANTSEVLNDTTKRFLPGLQERYPDVKISLEGESKESRKTGQSMLKALLVGVFGVFLILSFQFRSYLEPLAVMVAIPLALIGVIYGHLLMGHWLCMPSLMGFVSLAGVVVNDSILLVLFIKMHLAAGEDIHVAAVEASRQRLRAVTLTSLTTIMGLAPLMLEKSLQAQFLIPLAVAIIFGLIASTLLVLIVIPALYAILDDLGLTRRKRSEGEAA